MKITCDFCKTEYNCDATPGCAVKCAICGHCWNTPVQTRRNSWLMLFASICALMSAIMFVIAVVITNRPDPRASDPLIAQITDNQVVTNEAGIPQLVVSGNIRNQTADIYSVPDVIIILRDDQGNELFRQKFMPSATLLGADAQIEFRHVLSATLTPAVKSIDVKLDVPEMAEK